MDFRRPFTVVTPTLDGDVLAVLAAADVELSGRELARRARHGSTEGVRRAADRLSAEGIVLRRAVGGAHLYRLNTDHVAARWIEGIATLSEQVIARLGEAVEQWREPAGLAFLFGSAARREASSSSDIDILVVRGGDRDPDDENWRAQLVELQQSATRLTGNDVRVFELGEDELAGKRVEPILEEVVRDGIPLLGSRRALVQLIEAAR